GAVGGDGRGPRGGVHPPPALPLRRTGRSTPIPPAMRPRRKADRLDDLDRAHLIHGFGSPAVAEAEGTLRLGRGRGAYVWGSDGRRHLDGLASLGNGAGGDRPGGGAGPVPPPSRAP